ncbi:hypothetical protein [Oleisolibacter albus]|uniref:hypothetical protein n=1 Tax=Oleisolibacter albus TaxID=2171757 RepID=UPI000DF35918|nr:hypothetical protein [Oleisolibacter albus]
MVADTRGGPGAVGGVVQAGAAAPAGAAGSPQPKPMLSPTQATILSRPAELPQSGTAIVSGMLGSVLPGGEVPLTTTFGTVLLKPVPGAWPSELEAGNTVTVTLGPGNRVGNVQTAVSVVERTTVAPSPARALGGAEAALRGFLAAAGTEPAVQVPLRPPVATGQMSLSSAQPSTATAVQASTASPQLVATTGAMQPRVGVAPLVGAPVQADTPRPLAALQTAAGITDIQKGAGTGAQDLQQQAAIRSRAGGSGGGVEMAALPTPDDATPPAQDLQLLRPDLQLAQVLAHPGMLARMAAFLPRADRLGGAALLLYLFGARNGGARAWLGEEQLRHLTRSEAAALAEVEEAMVPAQRMTADGSVWTSVMVPFFDGDAPSVLLLSSMGGLVVPVDPDGEGQETAHDETAGETGTAFMVGLDLRSLGPVQLRGLSMPNRLVLDLAVAAIPDAPTQTAFENALDQALTGVSTGVSLRLHWGRAPFLMELMPGSARSIHERRL